MFCRPPNNLKNIVLHLHDARRIPYPTVYYLDAFPSRAFGYSHRQLTATVLLTLLSANQFAGFVGQFTMTITVHGYCWFQSVKSSNQRSWLVSGHWVRKGLQLTVRSLHFTMQFFYWQYSSVTRYWCIHPSSEESGRSSGTIIELVTLTALSMLL